MYHRCRVCDEPIKEERCIKRGDSYEHMPSSICEENLEGKCHALWLLNGGETGKWNGDSCNCEWIQGNLNCKRQRFIP
jgi:hypothetical protein